MMALAPDKETFDMAEIYEQHDAAFRNLSAYAILHEGEHVASVTVKYGARVWAYVHWIGLEMTRGYSGGGGYDRESAAVANAVGKMPGIGADHRPAWLCGTALGDAYDVFVRAARRDGGARWFDSLERAGFTICKVI